MKILALCNAMKGSLSAPKISRVLTGALSFSHTVSAFPISDGGDGFIDFFRAVYPAARLLRVRAQNAFGQSHSCPWLLLPDGQTAVIETARVCGLGSVKQTELDPLNATSFGVGQVILKAAQRGVKTIFVGLGGVACNDGGAGLAQALGVRFLDARGRELPPGAQALLNLHSADCSALNKTLKGVRIYAVADVTNPLLGPLGSARVFGPQKGATPQQVRVLERALTVYARITKAATGRDIAHTPSAAAAGAICAGLYGYANAKILLGADFLFKQAGLEKYVQEADLLITTEGKLDEQTFYGKAPLAALKLARKHKKPLFFICGKTDEKAAQHAGKLFPDKLAVLADFAASDEDSMRHAAKYLRRVCRNLL